MILARADQDDPAEAVVVFAGTVNLMSARDLLSRMILVPTLKPGVCQDWMLSPAFDQNPIGVECDPDRLVERFCSGVSVAELVVRD
jgi:hypothetical protein